MAREAAAPDVKYWFPLPPTGSAGSAAAGAWSRQRENGPLTSACAPSPSDGLQADVHPSVASDRAAASRGAGVGSDDDGSIAESWWTRPWATARPPTTSTAAAATSASFVRRRRRARATAAPAPGAVERLVTSCSRRVKAASRSKVSWSGMGGFSVRRAVQERDECGPAAGEPRLDGALGAPLLGGDLGHGEAGQVVEDQRPALDLGERPQCGHQRDGVLVGRRGVLRRPRAAEEAVRGAATPPTADRLPRGDLAHPGAGVVVRRELRPARPGPAVRLLGDLLGGTDLAGHGVRARHRARPRGVVERRELLLRVAHGSLVRTGRTPAS